VLAKFDLFLLGDLILPIAIDVTKGAKLQCKFAEFHIFY